MKARILIVEDEKAHRQARSSLLTDEGYEVLAAADGAAAQTIARQQEPDLILLEIRMPDVDELTVLEASSRVLRCCRNRLDGICHQQ